MCTAHGAYMERLGPFVRPRPRPPPPAPPPGPGPGPALGPLLRASRAVAYGAGRGAAPLARYYGAGTGAGLRLR